MFNKIKKFFQNKYTQMVIMISGAIFLTVAIALCIATLNTVPKEFFPLIQSLVAFMFLGMASLVLMVIMFMLIGKKSNVIFQPVHIHAGEFFDDTLEKVFGKKEKVKSEAPQPKTEPDPVPAQPEAPQPQPDQPPQG